MIYDYILGIVLIGIGIYLCSKFKQIDYIPAPEGNPDIERTTTDVGKLMIGVVLIGLGLMLLFNLFSFF